MSEDYAESYQSELGIITVVFLADQSFRVREEVKALPGQRTPKGSSKFVVHVHKNSATAITKAVAESKCVKG